MAMKHTAFFYQQPTSTYPTAVNIPQAYKPHPTQPNATSQNPTYRKNLCQRFIISPASFNLTKPWTL